MQKNRKAKSSTFLFDLLFGASHVKGHALNNRQGPVSGQWMPPGNRIRSCKQQYLKPAPRGTRVHLLPPIPILFPTKSNIGKETGHKVSFGWQIYGLLRGPYKIFCALYIIHF